jgi:acyl-CoA thioester hydrolase
MPSEYRLTRRVQFAETDMAGVVHFSCFFRYMEEAEHALWRSAGLSVASRMSEIGWPRVSASCDYRAPLRFEEEFDVLVRVGAMSEKTIRFDFQITRSTEEIARGVMTVVCVRQRAGEPMVAVPMPQEVRDCLEVATDVA